MKKCPVCSNSFTLSMLLKKNMSKSSSTLLGEKLADGKGVIRCPHCGTRLRKKISAWYIPAMIPFIVSAVLYYTNTNYWFLLILSAIIFLVFYIKLPYIPYNRD